MLNPLLLSINVKITWYFGYKNNSL